MWIKIADDLTDHRYRYADDISVYAQSEWRRFKRVTLRNGLRSVKCV